MKIFYITAILLPICNSIYADEVMIVAHRGASRDAPENTIPAFKLAWQQGADAIEGDFQLTKDGHIVCIHDKNTKRVANINVVVKESTMKELRPLDVGTHHAKKYSGTVIPTISEVFAIIPETKKIYIEIKCGTEIIPKLLDQIRESGLKQEQIVIICFDEKVIQELEAKAPQYKTLWLSDFTKDKSEKISPSLEATLTTLRQIKADGLSSSKEIPEPFVRAVKKHGYEYHVWTVDDLKTARRFKNWGAKSITTNVPGYMRKNLIEEDFPEDAHKPVR